MPKKKASKGRRKTNKGSPFEREIARKLSLWLSSGVAEDWFWRTAASGGRATNRAKQGKNTANGCGDICGQTKEAQDLLNDFVIEAKRGYNTATVSDLLDIEGGGVMGKFIDQARRSASLAGARHWAVIHKRDRRETLVITNCLEFVQSCESHFECWSDRETCFWVARLDDCLTPETRIRMQENLQPSLGDPKK
jgi:hypothetical protein